MYLFKGEPDNAKQEEFVEVFVRDWLDITDSGTTITPRFGKGEDVVFYDFDGFYAKYRCDGDKAEFSAIAGTPESAPAAAEAAPEAAGTEAAPANDAPAGPGQEHTDKATVKAAQQALNDAGYDCGKPDGIAGKNTKKAISSYQTDKGLTVTGTVTDELLAALGL